MPDRTGKKLRVRAWRRSPGRRASSQRLEGRGPSAWRPKPRLRMKFQVSPATGCGPDHSKKKLRPAWRWLPSRRIPSAEPLARKTAARRPPPRFSENCLANSLSNYKSMGCAASLSKTANEVSGQGSMMPSQHRVNLAAGFFDPRNRGYSPGGGISCETRFTL